MAELCATKAGIDWALLDECRGNGQGRQLLHESVKVTESLGIVNSCTVVVNGRKVCVRDDNKWRNCEVRRPSNDQVFIFISPQNGSEVEDFVRKIEDEYKALNDIEEDVADESDD